MKTLIGFSLLLISVIGRGQKIELTKEITTSKVASIKLYQFDAKNLCDQSKAVSIINESKKISPCFDYVRVVEKSNVKKIVNLLRSKSTYGSGEMSSCFDTDYALLMFDRKGIIVAYLNISFNCNGMIAFPKIKEQESFDSKAIRLDHFSKSGKKNFKMLLGVKG